MYNEREREREREGSGTTYQTPVMQVRIYTGDLRSIISGGLPGPRLLSRRHAPFPGDTTPKKSSIQKDTPSADPFEASVWTLTFSFFFR